MTDQANQIALFADQPWGSELGRAEPIAARLTRHQVQYIEPPGRPQTGMTAPSHITLLQVPNTRFLRRKRIAKFIQKIVSQSSVILVSSQEQAVQMQGCGKPVFPLPDGVDFKLYNEAAERNLPFPTDLFNVQNPIIGHLGALDGDTDLSVIEAAARAHPEWSFVFVGPVGVNTASLMDLKNIHLLGAKPPNLLPVYISRFDVCINVAKSTGASPVKLYQYLATGKPIVSTPHPTQVLDYTEAVYIAGTSEEFITCIKKAVGERDAWRVRRRVEYGRSASWDARVAELERSILELGL